MTRLEMVEKLRQKTGASYDDARRALEDNDWDMLDALIALKRESDRRSYTEETQKPDIIIEEEPRKPGIYSTSVGDKISGAVKFVLSLLSRGESIRVEIIYKDQVLGSISFVVLVLLLILCWYVPVLLLLLGLLMGFRFRVSTKGVTGKVMKAIGKHVQEEPEKELEIVSMKDKED